MMKFEARLENLSNMLSFIKQKATLHGLSLELIQKIELASEEAIVNVISYAYPKNLQHEFIFIECQKTGNARFEITIRDQGIPFNPLDLKLEADISKPLHERKIGGLGIYIIEHYMDEVIYRREGQENVLKMVISI